MIYLGIVLGLMFWIVDPFVDAVVLGNGGFVSRLLFQNMFEVYIRSLMFGILVLFGYYAHKTLQKSKRMEEAVLQTEEHYRTIIEYSNDLIWTLDRLGNFTFFNQKAEEISGYRLADWLGKSFAPLIWPDELPKIQQVFDETINGKSQQYDVQIIARNGSVVALSVNTAPILQGGAVIGTVSFGRDVSEQKRAEKALQESEERYRQILELSPDAMMVHSEGRIAFANPALARMLRISAPDRIVGKSMTEFVEQFIHPNYWLVVKERMQVLVSAGGVLPLSEEKIIRADGENLYVEVVASSFSFRGRQSVQVIFRDVTERKKLEEELLKADKLEAVGILAGGIAHDFNNILTIVSGNVSLAKMYLQTNQQHAKTLDKLVEIEEAAQQARDLTHQLLTFAKGGSPVKRTMPISNLIKENTNLALSGSQVRCEFFISSELWPVEIDGGQISRVINNLVINAVQSMPEGGTIRMRAENVLLEDDEVVPLPAGQYVAISIEDQGIGIPQKYLSKIFDPYFTTKQKGSGLGLATAYSITKKHHGHITVKSEGGVGTSFSVYLPASTRAESVEEQVQENVYFGQGRILFMDDEEAIRGVVEGMLTHLGYEVSFAQDGAGCIEMYRSAMAAGQPYDVVIMDLVIPGGMGGREAIRHLRDIDPDIKAIVTSGYSDDPIMADCRQYGFMASIAKPFRLIELSKVVYDVQ